MKRVLVCGAAGFIGGHLVRRLVGEGHAVRGADLVEPRYGPPETEHVLADLRRPDDCARVLRGGFDEVYQLAADMGGMEFITRAEAEIVHNNALININLVDAAARAEVGRYLLASSVCVYPDMDPTDGAVDERAAYPAAPDNEYGWEKLYAERVVATFARRHGFGARIARFENCYGPRGAWRGGREKAPAALCRKVALAADGDRVEVFGGGTTIRSFVHVADLVDAVVTLMRSDEARPTNIGVDERTTIAELVALIAEVAGKHVTIEAVDGPLGVRARNFSHQRLRALGWSPRVPLRAGIADTYPWIEEQVARAVARGGV